ncbi:MAG: aldo/keto reductase [Sedimentisphaerales bacterium]|jgi:predicted aldo/keto reductase-like oxidoreductase|nr:aldo/keto reductase [Sedimentisphaerales bacterium]
MERRTFLKTIGTVAGSYALGGGLSSKVQAAALAEEHLGVPQRILGRTGARISVVGFPGLALANYDQEQGTAGLHKAFDQGINYFDVAPAYGRDGDAEIKMGIGLQGIDRSRIFLACKTKMRDKGGAREELERSLKRLKTDYFDLYQMHAIFTEEEVKQALGPGGAIETFLKAKEEGKVRHFGFSAHTTAGAVAALNGFAFDSVMFPLSFVDYIETGFGKTVIELANEKGAGVIAIKALSKGAWPQGVERTRKWWYRTTETQKEVDLAVRFSLSLPGVVSAIPPSWLDLLDKAIDAGQSLRPITEAETLELRTMAKDCQPLFREEQQRAAMGCGIYPDCPHNPDPAVRIA